ncbi:beta-galactosidase [Seonamhaeicola maritimus]|uniref:beta-galactosidase n=1 Tax=Seonamhaeicola maritimus TaxID=2591822 RepID=UPI002493E96E|nr:beta-galactosidase [Seonamhaeicola maritimus]
MKKILILLVCLSTLNLLGQDLEKIALSKIKTLEKLVKTAEKNKIDVLKEKTTIRTAEIFLKYAEWDEKNIDANVKAFKTFSPFKKDAVKYATELPDFERNDIIKMLDTAINEIKLLNNGEIFRVPSPKIDWSKVSIDNDQLTYKNKPVFLADYTWKPNTKELEEYHGMQDGFFITPSYIINQNGELNKRKKEELENKPSGNLGFIFMNHKGVPKWSEAKYGPNFKMREDTYTAYDIDNPGARIIQEHLIKQVAPYAAGKNYSKLGYMLCNEPHFFTQRNGNKKAWASGPVSEYTITKFKDWLKNKHKNITELNKHWKTDYTSFKEVSIEIPIDAALKGTAKWYDWALFNMDRVTDWYNFLKDEILKHDPNGKVHLKIMPVLWTGNQRIHGIDLEKLTDISGIIGNDSGADHKVYWGKHEWEKQYKFEWRELCMGFDFMKSVSPNKINFNSELHYLSTVRSRDLYLDPAYARASFWLAHTYGMTASQIWYWPRNADGSISKKATNDKGYAGSNNQQPRVTNEVAITLIDLNSYAEEIMAFQRARKPLRIFYSKTSAINKETHMDDVFELYEGLHFNGSPIGFVTQNIIEKQENKNWDLVLIHKTPFVTQSEFDAVQSYLNKGGTVLIDKTSFKKNEYGILFNRTLKQGNGVLIELDTTNAIEEKAMSLLKDKGLLSDVFVQEVNELGMKGCAWKVIKNNEGKHILSIVNVGKTNAQLTISLRGAKEIICKDLLKGIEVSSTPNLKPNEVYFVEVSTK